MNKITLTGLNKSCRRLKKFLKLNAPFVCIENELGILKEFCETYYKEKETQ